MSHPFIPARTELAGSRPRPTKSSVIAEGASVRTRPVFELQIQELVLQGFSPNDRHALGDALELELSGLIAQSPLDNIFTQAAEIRSLDAGTVTLLSRAPTSEVGRQLARAIHGGVRKWR